MKTKIRNLKLENGIFLAPMLEPNDIAFRLLCKKARCESTFTGMTSPLSKKKLYLYDRPILQLFGNSSKGIKSFIKKYDPEVSGWDFNLGCPSKLSKQLKHGAFMHDDIETIENILKIMRKSTDKFLSIKLRKSKNSLKIAKIAESIGVDAIGIHPRTITQGYSGEPDYEFALRIKNSVNIPIIYSGNVNSKNYKKILKDFDFVMVGREAIGNPEIFSKISNGNYKNNFNDYLKLAKKYDINFKQIKFQAMTFTKGNRGARKTRAKLIFAKNIEDLKLAYQNK